MGNLNTLFKTHARRNLESLLVELTPDSAIFNVRRTDTYKNNDEDWKIKFRRQIKSGDIKIYLRKTTGELVYDDSEHIHNLI